MFQAHIVPLDLFGELHCDVSPQFGRELATMLIEDAVYSPDICERRLMVLLESMEGHEDLSEIDTRLLVREGQAYFYNAKTHLHTYKVKTVHTRQFDPAHVILIV